MTETVAKAATRDGFGKGLARVAKANENVVAFDCDLGRSCRSYEVAAVDPRRFIDMGIAEQDMMSTAAGMAHMGKIVFASTFAVFITGRAFDQIRQQVALPRCNVKICGSSAGLTMGPDGATHQALLDVALMRSLPNMVVLVPADSHQAEQVVAAAAEHDGPVYIRLSRYETPDFLPPTAVFRIGEGQVLREGREVVLVSCGPVLFNVLKAAQLLEKDGLSVGIVNIPTLKPIDTPLVERLSSAYSHIVTVEEHTIFGGLGSAIAECIAESTNPSRKAVIHRIGVRDTFGESGLADELLKKHGLDPVGIADSVRRFYRGEKA